MDPTLRQLPATNPGRRGLPPETRALMYADYQRLGSIAKVAKLWGRTRQAIWGVLNQTCGHQLNPLYKVRHEPVHYGGRLWTPGKNGYLRATDQRNPVLLLHHFVWEEHHGPIPPGHKVVFKDGDRRHWNIDNLVLLTRSEQSARGATGANQFTKTADARLDLLLNRAGVAREPAAAPLLSTALKARAAR